MKSRKQAIFAAVMSSIIAVNSFGLSAFATDPCEHTEDLEKVDGKAATCVATGTAEYWVCKEDTCGQKYATSDRTQPIDEPEEIPVVPHQITAVAAKDATCTEAGNKAHYKCTVCNGLFTDEEGENSTTATEQEIAAAHTIVEVPAKAATCTEKGNNKYYKCSVCNSLFSDAAGTTTTTAEAQETPAAHTYSAQVSQVAATCAADGTKAHYTCTVCNKKFLNTTSGVEATAADLKLAKEDVEHTFGAAVDGKKTCSVCNKEVAVAECTHTRTEVAAKAATCTEAGNKAYYTCSDEGCAGKKFSTASGEAIVLEDADVTIAALGHNYGDWVITTPATATEAGVKTKTCARCSDEQTEAIPATGSTPDPTPTPTPDPTPTPTPDPDPTPAPVPTEAVKVDVEEKEITEDNNAIKEDVTVTVEPGKPATDAETGVSVTVSATDAAAKETTLKVEAPTSTKDIATWAEEVLTNVESAKAADVKKSVEEAINAVSDGKGFALNLKLVDSDNKAVQPDKTVQITVPVPATYKTAEKLFVYHITERGAVEVLSKMVDGNIVINAGSFSPYIITTEKLANVKTYDNGDADLDERLSARDATAVLKHCVETAILKDEGLFYADMNGDGIVTAADATAILKSCVEKA